MTKPDYTAICLVIDSSGSMADILDSTNESVNAFITEQAKAEGTRTIRIATFSSEFSRGGFLHDSGASTPAAGVERFSLQPDGGTALLDAMGTMMTRFGKELADLPEDQRPAHVIFAVMTDGYENSSREYSWERIQTMCLHQQQAYQWEIIYLGANQDAIATAGRLGVPRRSSITYATNDVAVASVGQSLSSYVASSAAGMRSAFTDEDRTRAMSGEREAPDPS